MRLSLQVPGDYSAEHVFHCLLNEIYERPRFLGTLPGFGIMLMFRCSHLYINVQWTLTEARVANDLSTLSGACLPASCPPWSKASTCLRLLNDRFCNCWILMLYVLWLQGLCWVYNCRYFTSVNDLFIFSFFLLFFPFWDKISCISGWF